MGSQNVPQDVLHITSLLSHMLWQMLSSFHLWIWWAKGEELCISKYNLLCWGASIVSFFLSDAPIKLACCKKKEKKRTWEAPHLINRRGEIGKVMMPRHKLGLVVQALGM
jgi:hypothetical protein